MNGACKYCGKPWETDYRCCVKDPPTARIVPQAHPPERGRLASKELAREWLRASREALGRERGGSEPR